MNRPCKDCGMPIMENSYRGRPRKYCKACYEKSRSIYRRVVLT